MTAAIALLAASRTALVVGVDAYAFTPTNVSDERRLCAAARDVDAVGGMLDAAGFMKTVLLQGRAKRADVERGLQALADGATKGSDVFFYFSGRGATSNDARLEPTLVPADGQEKSPAMDVPMSLVEDMARKASAKGAHVTVVVDACFFPAQRPRSLETRLYKPIQKCVRRDRGVREDLWRSPGVFLCPAGSRGAAYEWLAAFPDGWTSAFTDVLTGAAMTDILVGRLPKVRPMIAEAEAYFRSRVSSAYMVGTAVSLPPSSRDPGYDLPFLSAGPLPPLKPELRVLADRAVAALRARERTLRVAVDVDPGIDAPDRRKAIRARLADLKPALESIDGLRLVSAYEKPDRVVTASDTNGLTLAVRGGDATRTERPTFSGDDPKAVVAAGLGDYLEREMLVKRLWNLASAAEETADWSPSMVATTIPPNSPIGFDFETTTGGYLYVLNRDELDEEAKLFFPNLLENTPYLAAGKGREPKFYQNVPGQSTPGRSVLLAVFVPADASLPPLPAYVPGSGAEAANRAFEGPLVAHLRALLERLESGVARLRVRRLEHTILP